MNNAAQILDPFVEQWAVLLTTYKRDGTPVGTAVNIVVEGDHAYFRTWDTAWKLKRIRNNPDRGRGRPVHTPQQADRAYGAGPRQGAGRQWVSPRRRLLARKYPFSHGVMVPLVHRLRGNTTMHLELRPVEDASRDRA